MISQTKQKGFTIVELLIVIVIIAILAAISIVAYNSITQRARDTQRATNAGNLAKAVVNYNAVNNGKWLSATEISTAGGPLDTWKDPEISHSILRNVISSGDPTNDQLKLELCPSTATPGSETGAKVTYRKEADTANPGVVTVGSGC